MGRPLPIRSNHFLKITTWDPLWNVIPLFLQKNPSRPTTIRDSIRNRSTLVIWSIHSHLTITVDSLEERVVVPSSMDRGGSGHSFFDSFDRSIPIKQWHDNSLGKIDFSFFNQSFPNQPQQRTTCRSSDWSFSDWFLSIEKSHRIPWGKRSHFFYDLFLSIEPQQVYPWGRVY